MGILDTIKSTFARPASSRVVAIDSGPLILEYDGERVYPIAGKGIATTSGEGWTSRRRGYREIPATESGYAQAYMAVVWLQRAADIRANKVAELLHQGEVVSKSTGEVIEDHPLMDAFKRSRVSFRHDLFRRWEYWRILTGEAYIEPVRGTLGNIPFFSAMFGFQVVNSLACEPVIVNGQITGFEVTQEGMAQTLGPNDLIYDYTFNPFDDNRGKSMLTAVMDDMNIQRGVLIAAKNYSKNGLHSRVVFVAKNGEITGEEKNRLLATLREQATGPEGAGRPLVLSSVLAPTVLDPAAPTEQRVYKQDAQQAAATATGVPLPLIVYEQNPYQLSPEQRIGWYDNSLIPEAQDMALVVDTQMLPYFGSNADHEFRLPVDDIRANLINPKERAEMVKTKLHGGWWTFNQALQAEGRQPIPNGDFYLMPSGMTAVKESDIIMGNAQIQPPQPMQLQAVPQEPPRQLPDLSQPQLITPQPIRSSHIIDFESNDDDLTIHGQALAELDAWRRFRKNGTVNKRAFKTLLIRADIADDLRAALREAADDLAVNKAFDLARAQIEVKAIQATRLDFENEFEALLNAARSGDMERASFSSRLRTMLRRYGEKAYRDGLTDGGVILELSEPLPDDDAATLAIHLAEQSQYVSSFGEVLFKKDGITDTQATMKPEQWFSRSVMPLYHAGVGSADKNGMYECVGQLVDDSCDTCIASVGQVHRFRDWAKNDLLFPHGAGIICSDGGHCHHTLKRVNARASGSLSRIPRKTLEVL